MEKGRELYGYYGRSHIPCTIFEYEGWYCVKGSLNVPHTMAELKLGVDIEELQDDDFLTADKPVKCIEDLIREVKDYVE
jgi:predicted amidohydrolase